MLTSDLLYCGVVRTFSCDRCCEKAWGINDRPKKQLSDNPDDYAYLPDQELGTAPLHSGTSEGGERKPLHPTVHNRWCVRACERCEMSAVGNPIVLPDFSQLQYNIPTSDPNHVQ